MFLHTKNCQHSLIIPSRSSINIIQFNETESVFMKVRLTVGHVRQKPPQFDKYFCIAGQVVRWNIWAKTGVKTVDFGQRILREPVNRRSTNQNMLHKAWPAGYRCVVFKTCLSLYLPSLDGVPIYLSWVFAISKRVSEFLEDQIYNKQV